MEDFQLADGEYEKIERFLAEQKARMKAQDEARAEREYRESSWYREDQLEILIDMLIPGLDDYWITTDEGKAALAKLQELGFAALGGEG